MDSLEQPAGPERARPGPTYVGNDSDLIALIALVVSIIGVLSCVSGGNICFILPLAGIALGAVGWIQSSRAVNPGRARTLSMVSTISMSAIFALVICAFLAYIAFIIILVVTSVGAGAG